MDKAREAYEEVYAYTMGHSGASFILQHVVDAFAAQTAGVDAKPIGVTFALVGLYLYVEKGFSGRQVQRVHMQPGRRKRQWRAIPLPRDRGRMTLRIVTGAL